MSVTRFNHLYTWMLVLAISLISIPLVENTVDAASWKQVARKSDYHFGEGKRLFKQRRFASAERELTEALYYTRKLKRKCSGVIRSCRMTDKRGFYRRYSKIYVLRGGTFYFRSKYSTALDDFQSAISQNPNNTFAHYYLGKTHVRLRNKQAALKQYRFLKRTNAKYATKLYRFIYP